MYSLRYKFIFVASVNTDTFIIFLLLLFVVLQDRIDHCHQPVNNWITHGGKGEEYVL